MYIYIYISTFNNFPSNTILWEIHFHGNSITFANTPLEDNPTTRPVVFQFSSPKRLNWRCLCFQLADQWSFSRLEQILVGNGHRDDIEFLLETLNNFPAKKGVWKHKCQTPSTTIPKTANTNFIRLSCDSANGPNTKRCYPQRDAKPMSPANQLEF